MSNLKIDWSGRSHKFTNKDVKYLSNIIQNADPLTQGKYLREFESKTSKYLRVNSKNIYAVSSAAAALEIISTLLQLKKGDEVIIPAHTYCASAIPFARRKAKIIWSDIDFKTRVSDINDIKKKITRKTKAIVIVHLYGYHCDFRKIINFCKRKNIKIIEDCAQAFGSQLGKKKSGTYGDFACYSFHSQKNITTLGEGGMIYVKDNKLASKVPGLRHNGHCNFKFRRKNYWLPAMGNLDIDLKNQWPFKFTLSEIQCGAGIVMLKKLDKLKAKASKKIEPSLLLSYEKLVQRQRNGLAVVKVSRGACGGCFNVVPAQRQAEIREKKKIILCEYCGRILADVITEVVEEKPKKRTVRKKATTKKKVVTKKKVAAKK